MYHISQSSMKCTHGKPSKSNSTGGCSRDLIERKFFAHNNQHVGGHHPVSRAQTTMSTSIQPPQLRGSKPGQLDDTQPSRLLRDSASKLCFASFDPFTARQDDGAEKLRNLSLNEKLYRPKRVVIEMTSSGSFWRFVPRMVKDDGLQSEEHWPRLVDICG